jgi:hypothetical protein
MSDGRKCPEYRPPATKLSPAKDLLEQVSASVFISLGLPNDTKVTIASGNTTDFHTTSSMSAKFPGIHTSYCYIQLELTVSPLPESHIQPCFRTRRPRKDSAADDDVAVIEFWQWEWMPIDEFEHAYSAGVGQVQNVVKGADVADLQSAVDGLGACIGEVYGSVDAEARAAVLLERLVELIDMSDVNKTALFTVAPRSSHPDVVALLTDALNQQDVTIVQLSLGALQGLACMETLHVHIATHAPLKPRLGELHQQYLNRLRGNSTSTEPAAIKTPSFPRKRAMTLPDDPKVFKFQLARAEQGKSCSCRYVLDAALSVAVTCQSLLEPCVHCQHELSLTACLLFVLRSLLCGQNSGSCKRQSLCSQSSSLLRRAARQPNYIAALLLQSGEYQ